MIRTASAPSMSRCLSLYEEAASMVSFGGWSCELESETLTWTRGVYDLFGLNPDEPPTRRTVLALYHDESRLEMERLRAAAIASGGSFTLDARIRTIAGLDRWMRLTARATQDSAGRGLLFGAKQDITPDRQLWEHLRRLAERDPLTGLGNRAVFDTRCTDMVEASRREGALSALVLIDLNDFKEINDEHGHAAGDECLRRVAARLEHAFRHASLVARIGGDEFAALVPIPGGRPQLARLLAAGRRILCQPVSWGAASIEIGASIGAAVVEPARHRSPAELFAEADSALYVAKATGRNAIRVFGAPVGRSLGGAPACPSLLPAA